MKKKKTFVKGRQKSSGIEYPIPINRIVHTENPYLSTKNVDQYRAKWRKNMIKK